ncbi:hypothetical protein M885DRAFT_529338, partial [Pelagophyceae sp. CCMP2097]
MAAASHVPLTLANFVLIEKRLPSFSGSGDEPASGLVQLQLRIRNASPLHATFDASRPLTDADEQRKWDLRDGELATILIDKLEDLAAKVLDRLPSNVGGAAIWSELERHFGKGVGVQALKQAIDFGKSFRLIDYDSFLAYAAAATKLGDRLHAPGMPSDFIVDAITESIHGSKAPSCFANLHSALLISTESMDVRSILTNIEKVALVNPTTAFRPAAHAPPAAPSTAFVLPTQSTVL